MKRTLIVGAVAAGIFAIVQGRSAEAQATGSAAQYNRAVDDYNAKRYAEAGIALRDYLKSSDKNVDAHRMLADIDIRQNKVAEAIPEMEAILRLAPKDSSWRANLGSAYLQTGQFDKAAALFETAMEASPADADAAYYYGLSLSQAGRFEQAIAPLQKSITLKPSADKYLQMGVAFNKSGKPAEAAAAFEAAARLDPKNAQAPLYAGVLYHQSGNDSKAMPLLKKALELGTTNLFDAHIALGEAAQAAGEREEAIRQFALAAQDKPDDFNTLANLGILYQDSGSSPEAETAYRKALALRPDDPKALASVQYNLALLLLDSKPAEALTLLTQAAQGDPQSANYPYALGTVYEKLGKTAEATEAYQRAIALDPKMTDAQQALDRLKK